MTAERIASRVVRTIPVAEKSVDDAIAALADLMAAIVRARWEAGVPASTGQATILRLAKAQMQLVEVSNNVLRVHGEIAALGKEHMSWPECPPDKDGEKKLFGIMGQAA